MPERKDSRTLQQILNINIQKKELRFEDGRSKEVGK